MVQCRSFNAFVNRGQIMTAKLNFVRQQGFPDASPETCSYLYPALMWQPRVIGILFLVGLAFQAASFFLALGALLWWNAIFPAFNPFDAIYNLVAKPKSVPRLLPAPAPRQFAQAEAGTVIAAIGLALLGEVNLLAYILEGLALASLGALIFGRFCQGSYLYLLFTGQSAVANRTLPWSA
jgi:uncharacterized protein DUF4395